MVAFEKIVMTARIARGLLAGKDGDSLIANLRDSQVIDPEPLLKKVAVGAFLAILAFGFARMVPDHAPLTAALHESGTRTDL